MLRFICNKTYLSEGGVVDVDLEDDIDMLPEHLFTSPKTLQPFDCAPELNVLAAELLLEELFKKPSTFSAFQQGLKTGVWIQPRFHLF